MSDDLISRQAAIKALYTEIIKRRLLDDVNDGALDEFDTESILRALPSAQPGWIPCSEKLPERNQICIVTDETRRCAYEYGLHDETYDDATGWTYLGHKIIAWMPLPEPYKGEQP